MKKLLLLAAFILFVSNGNAQSSINDLKNQTDLSRLTASVRELSGEDPTTVGGNPVTITHRVSNNGNDLAADYIKERLAALGLIITDQVYSAGGRNIIATQTGVTNPNDIYVVCAHYDSVANYCGDDNASGTAAILELARILSPLCLDNTIVYAFWDEEELGLLGSKHYAQQASANGDNILGVFNIDMMAYDNDDDNDFDIDVRNIANSIAMKDQIINVLNDPTYGFTLNVNVVNPGTTASDHSSFWNEGYSGVLFGESWLNNDYTSGYHTANDRIGLFNMPYYHEMSKLMVAYMATIASPIFIDKSISQNTTSLIANEAAATYQWVDCDNANAPISGETNQTFSPSVSGNYAVEITKGNCTELSSCTAFNVLGIDDFDIKSISLYPNPAKNKVKIIGLDSDINEFKVSLTSITGQEIVNKRMNRQHSELDLKMLSSGVYLVGIELANGKSKVLKLIKN